MARGPAYPFVDLQSAVDFALKVFHYARRSAVKTDSVITEAWKYSPKSSGSGKTLAALKYFGLLDEVGGNDGRLVKISDRAYRILFDNPDSPERMQALREAVLSPKAYLLCWNRWGADMPPSMRSTLIFDDGFIESTVDGFIADYKRSIEYAGLLSVAPEREQEPKYTEGEISTRLPAITTSGIAVTEAKGVRGNENDQQRHDVFSLAEGTVSISWPKQISSESFQDLSDWLEILKRKIERTTTTNLSASPAAAQVLTSTGKHYFIERNVDGNYSVRTKDSDRASAVFNTQAEAIEHAKKLGSEDRSDAESFRHGSRASQKWQ